MLESQFFDHTNKAGQEDYMAALEAIDQGPHSNYLAGSNIVSHHRGRSRAGTALPGKWADELDLIAERRVARAETGDIDDPVMSNKPIAGKHRQVTTNEPPLPQVPSNMVGRKIGGSGVVQDRTRDVNAQLAHRNRDPHRLLNSFVPDDTRLKEYEWNPGGPTGVHQGLAIRFNNLSTFNRYGRQVNPRDVPKKEPLPMTYDPRPALAAPLSTELSMAERRLAPRVRDNSRADFADIDHLQRRPPTKDVNWFAPTGRPDQLIHHSRRDNPEPHLSRLEMPFIPKSRHHALAAGEEARSSMRQLLEETF